MRAPRPLATCSDAVPTPPAAPCTSTRLALRQAPAQLQREVGGVVVQDQRGALGEVELVGQRERQEVGRHGDLGEAAEHAARRRRGRPRSTPSPSGALRTTPATSLPGTNGSGGLIWYSPRVWSTSGNDTPAAWTSITHAAARREHVRRLGLGQVDQLSALRGPGKVDDLEGSHAATCIGLKGPGYRDPNAPPLPTPVHHRRGACRQPRRGRREGPQGPRRQRVLQAAQEDLRQDPRHADLGAQAHRQGRARASRRATTLVLYRSTGSNGRPNAVSGTVTVPQGKAPKGGWPILTWAHGTTGIADSARRRARRRTRTRPTSTRADEVAEGRLRSRAHRLPGPRHAGRPRVPRSARTRAAACSTSSAPRASPSAALQARDHRRPLAGRPRRAVGGRARQSWTPELKVRGTVAFAPASHIGEQASLIRAVTTPSGLSVIAALIIRAADTAEPSLELGSLLRTRPRRCTRRRSPSAWASTPPTRRRHRAGGDPQHGADIKPLVAFLKHQRSRGPEDPHPGAGPPGHRRHDRAAERSATSSSTG